MLYFVFVLVCLKLQCVPVNNNYELTNRQKSQTETITNTLRTSGKFAVLTTPELFCCRLYKTTAPIILTEGIKHFYYLQYSITSFEQS